MDQTVRAAEGSPERFAHKESAHADGADGRKISRCFISCVDGQRIISLLFFVDFIQHAADVRQRFLPV